MSEENKINELITKLIIKKQFKALRAGEKEFLDDFIHPVKKVESKVIEKGTSFIVDLVKNNPGIQLSQLVEKSGFAKKKIKRILNSSNLIREETNFRITRYYIN